MKVVTSNFLYHGFAEKYFRYPLSSQILKRKRKVEVDVLLIEQCCYEDDLFAYKSDFILTCLFYII